jgi:hypothetical protein
MTPITWHRITRYSERAMRGDELLPYVVRQYGQSPTLWEVMEMMPGVQPMRTVAGRLRTESAAKQAAIEAIERAGL